MAIEPIGVGASGMSFGSWGGYSAGIGAYRRNASDYNNSWQNGSGGKVLPSVQSVPQGDGNKIGNEVEIIPDGKGGMKYGTVDEKAEIDRKRRFDSFECQTCKNRKYQDGSDDSGVSFQTPTKIAPGAVASKVRSHEQEHVSRNQAKADREGNEVVSQTVTLHTAICPECGRLYISGGTTRSTIRKSVDNNYSVGMFDPSSGKGKALNKSA